MIATKQDDSAALFEYWDVVKRRYLLFLVPAVAIGLFTLYLAAFLPSIYRSEATILIEDRDLPPDIVGATFGNYASQQVHLVRQRLLTVDNIQTIVDKYEVYGPRKSTDSAASLSLANRFRSDLDLELVSTDVYDARGRSGEAAIAFTVAYQSEVPEIAQQVTEELVSLFLNENQRSGAVRTTEVSELMRAAVADANEALLEAEAELADFKTLHEGALPELQLHNLNALERTERQLSDVSLRIQELERRKLQLTAQLAPLSRSAPITLPTGETIMSDRERLRALLTDYRRKSALYQPGHPDLETLERQIETLQSSIGDVGSRQLLEEQLQKERERLQVLKERYSDDHPDVANSESAILALESQLVALGEKGEPAIEEMADNPAYVLVNTQLQSVELELNSLRQKRSQLETQVSDYEQLMRRAPRVEMEYLALFRKYETARANHSNLSDKLRAAQVAATVGQELTGRRFTLLEPPALPRSPYGPNRMATVLLGFVLAIGVSFGCVIVAELVDTSIRSARNLAAITGRPPLAVIPYLNNEQDLAHAKVRRMYLILGFLLLNVICLVYIHLYVRSVFNFA